jgi:hypothetical protein
MFADLRQMIKDIVKMLGVCKKFVGILAGYSIDDPTGHCRKKWGGYTKPTKNLHTQMLVKF